MMHHIMSVVVIVISLFSSNELQAREMTQRTAKHQLSEEKQEHIIQWARDHLPQEGVLTEENRGFVYLKVDDEYINQLFPLLLEPDYSKPPYFRRPDSPGAHISIFYVNERQQTGEIAEIGKKYSFKITGLALVPAKTRQYIVLEVESSDLEELRKKYDLSPLLQGHKFHITIAKKREKGR